jgi:C-terminal processing protease CtpA/Prc
MNVHRVQRAPTPLAILLSLFLSAGTGASTPAVSSDEPGAVGVQLAQLYFERDPKHRGPLIVLSVAEGLPAARAGLAKGDIVVAVDGAPVIVEPVRTSLRSEFSDRPAARCR